MATPTLTDPDVLAYQLAVAEQQMFVHLSLQHVMSQPPDFAALFVRSPFWRETPQADDILGARYERLRFYRGSILH